MSNEDRRGRWQPVRPGASAAPSWARWLLPTARRWRAGRELLRYRHHLRPGWWVVTDPTLPYLVGSPPLPGHAQEYRHYRLLPAATLRTAARRRIAPLLPFALVRVPPGPCQGADGRLSPPGNATALLRRPTHNGDRLLFDTTNGLVLRLLTRPLSEEAVALRRTLEKYLPGPRFVVRQNGWVLEEELVEGEAYFRAAYRDRREAVGQLQEGYRRLTENEATGDSRAVVGAAINAVFASRALPRRYKDVVASLEERLRAASRGWPLAPAHGDLSTRNVVLSDEGPMQIDFESAARLPFMFDVLTLLIHDAIQCTRGPDLIIPAMNGTSRRYTEELWVAAGREWTPEDLGLALLATLLIFSHRRSLGTASGVRDHRSYVQLLEGRWGVIHRWFPQTFPG